MTSSRERDKTHDARRTDVGDLVANDLIVSVVCVELSNGTDIGNVEQIRDGYHVSFALATMQVGDHSPSIRASTPMDPALYTPEDAAPAPLPAIVPPVAMMTTLGRVLGGLAGVLQPTDNKLTRCTLTDTSR